LLVVIPLLLLCAWIVLSGQLKPRAPAPLPQAKEPISGRTITTPPGSALQDEGRFPSWEEDFQWEKNRPRTAVRAAVFGSLAGGIFFFGLAAAILSGHFWPVFLAVLALTSLLGPLGSSKLQAIYAGVQGCVFLLGLAVLAFTGWWWPGVLVVLGIAAILGIGNALLALWPVARPGMTVDQYYTALRDHDYARAYGFLDANLTAALSLEQFTAMVAARDAAEGAVSRYSIAPDPAVTTTPLPGEPLPLVTFTRKPPDNLIVSVRRTHAPSYIVHLQVRHEGKRWTISAFDRI
jgi:hypothetical protein